MKTEDIIKGEAKYILQTYGRPEFVLERGNGVYLFDTDGNRYLDFVSGLAVNALGYGDYDVLKAIEEQSAKLMHVSNLYHTIPSVQLARLLVENSFADRVFFCNSGTESWEATLKFCRKWGNTTHAKPKNRLLAFNDSFHGRTYGSISTTGQPKYHQGFEPLLPGIDFADFNDLACKPRAAFTPPRRNFSRGCASSATSARCCWSSTRSRWAAGASVRCGPISSTGSSPIS